MNQDFEVKDIHILLIFGIIFMSFVLLNYSGFCVKEFRYLSSKEKIKSLFNIWNRSYGDNILIDGEYKFLERKNRYANFDEFLLNHPDCCQIDPGGPYDIGSPNFINRITGYDSGTVIRLKFNEQYIDPDGNVLTSEIEVLDRLQNCGESRW